MPLNLMKSSIPLGFSFLIAIILLTLQIFHLKVNSYLFYILETFFFFQKCSVLTFCIDKMCVFKLLKNYKLLFLFVNENWFLCLTHTVGESTALFYCTSSLERVQ